MDSKIVDFFLKKLHFLFIDFYFFLISGPIAVGPDNETPEFIRQLAHAYKCQERDNQENDIMMICALPHCREHKILLNHMQTCQIGINCCGSTKNIVDHWNRCCIHDCPICSPVRQAERNINSSIGKPERIMIVS